MPLSGDWTLEADEIMALPVDDLALRVLKDARDNNEWNWQNWLKRARTAYREKPDAVLALTEAWSWLLNRGLVVWNVAQDSAGSFLVSRQGHAALDQGLLWIRAVQRLDIELVPVLEAKARPQFLRGDFEAAALLAMKEVELRVRTMAGLPNSLTGTALMQQAFRPGKGDQDAGPLVDTTADGGEAVGTMELFKGAIGLFKNPPSHRRVDYTDPTEAAEVLLLADLLMRLLNKIEES
ncbi:TIGR02391 family protein [Streptomyces sp. NPDC046862]|uniref:TIGR02391 family protein n=1 Tax=Streptomyces sp. NPDC046862 TaxID=3154603 RepID=UPI003451FA37